MYRLTRVLATVLLLVVWSGLGVAACDATIEGAPLFRETTRQPAAAPPEAPRVVRARYAEVDFGVLGGDNPAVASAPATVLLNLFPDASFIAERDGAQATSTGGGLVWTGHLQGVPASTATLVAEDGVLVGNVQA